MYVISTEFSQTPCVMNLRESSESILRNVGRFSGDIRLAVCLTDKIFAALSRSATTEAQQNLTEIPKN